MRIKTFDVERWMDLYENDAVNNIAETCVNSMSVRELLELAGDTGSRIQQILDMRLTYGAIPGSLSLREGITGLYETMGPENVLVMNGGSASNFLTLYALVEPGDHVISVNPTYQQLYSIPESFGARVDLLELKPEEGFLPDPGKIAGMITPETKMICLNNPNNPTGALMGKDLLEEIVEVARSVDAWILCDEVYRMLVHEQDLHIPAMADLYEKGISVGSMSKAFSLAGLRLGWIAGSEDLIHECILKRDYTNISCGMIDDYLAALAMEKKDAILERNLGIIRSNIAILDEWVKGEPRIDYVKPRAGTTAFIHYDYHVPSREFCTRLIELNGTFVVPGDCFGRENWIRVGYAFDPAVLEAGLKGISILLRELEKEGL
ncbi:MAG: aminotransferase [Synergistales bacterium]|nr:aminotransferase [Synergistales bacterium]